MAPSASGTASEGSAGFRRAARRRRNSPSPDKALVALQVQIIRAGRRLLDDVDRQLRRAGIDILLRNQPFSEIGIVGVELVRGGDGHLVPAGEDPFRYAGLEFVVPLGVEGAA